MIQMKINASSVMFTLVYLSFLDPNKPDFSRLISTRSDLKFMTDSL